MQLLKIIQTAAADCRVQGNTMAANELLDAVRMARESIDLVRDLVTESLNDMDGAPTAPTLARAEAFLATMDAAS